MQLFSKEAANTFSISLRKINFVEHSGLKQFQAYKDSAGGLVDF